MGKILELFGKIMDIGSSAAGAVKSKPIVTATSIIAFVVAVLGLLGYLDSRYALASDLAQTNQAITQTNKAIADQSAKTNQIANYLKMQAISRKTILEMKAANHKITAEERVELENLKEMLKTFN